MGNNMLIMTEENIELTKKLDALRLEFLELFTRHKNMVENESVILTSLYLDKLGHLQLELLEKQTEVSRLKMKMNMIQAAINRHEDPDLKSIDQLINERLQTYYAQIQAQSAALDGAKKVLSNLLSEEETQKLKEIFFLLCKRLHPDLNPNQTEEEKDLFVKVKAAYDLQRLSDLQQMLLYLDDSKKEKLTLIPLNEKIERIAHLEKQISSLRLKIDQLEKQFPFNMKELIYNENEIAQKQSELRIQIKSAEEEQLKYLKIINLLTDE